jgi:hypothetical protein
MQLARYGGSIDKVADGYCRNMIAIFNNERVDELCIPGHDPVKTSTIPLRKVAK